MSRRKIDIKYMGGWGGKACEGRARRGKGKRGKCGVEGRIGRGRETCERVEGQRGL